jgi:hypothetical protein
MAGIQEDSRVFYDRSLPNAISMNNQVSCDCDDNIHAGQRGKPTWTVFRDVNRCIGAAPDVTVEPCTYSKLNRSTVELAIAAGKIV